MKKTKALILSTLALALQSTAFAAVDCSQASQRDATCIGSVNALGTNSTDPAKNNSSLSTTGLPSGTARPRGSNSINSGAVSLPNYQKPNSCVAAPLVSFAWDPAAYGSAWPSFVVPAGSGYLGSGASSSPLEACSSPTDPGASWLGGPSAACTTWVPETHPYLFVGGQAFTQCNGHKVNGSIACSTPGKNAYVSSNPGAQYQFRAYMIACEKNTSTSATQLFGAPFDWWKNCSTSPYCDFFVYYPSQYEGGGN